MIVFKAKNICSALKKKGFVENRSRDHIRYTLYVNGKKTSIFTFISHDLRDYSGKLIGEVKKQLRLQSTDELQNFINCPMTEEEYMNLLTERKHIIISSQER